MHRFGCSLSLLLLSLCFSVQAAVVTFNTAPFEGSAALSTPGRQIVGGEPSINFSIANDVFAFDPGVFNLGGPLQFANDVVANLPASGSNVLVLQSLDNDNDATTSFGAGNAANLIAEQLTSPSAGFFIYFNSGLDLARLVYSTDLSDSTADLKILARLSNLNGQAGRDALPTFTADNFALAVPEPSTLWLLILPLATLLGTRRRRRLSS